MKKIAFLRYLLVLWVLNTPPLEILAQGNTFSLSGTVHNEAGKPVELAVVVLNGVLGASTKADGTFRINNVPTGTYQWRVSYVGYETQTGTLEVKTGRERLNVVLKELNLKLQQVTVTARQTQMGSISKIDQEAIRHLQPKSLGDLLQLAPGNLTENPNLNDLSQAQIREIGTNAANAMGTAVIVDGTPLSNDANLEVMAVTRYGSSSDGSSSSLGAQTTAGRGTDLRTVQAGNIESMEVIRGIPSVEYGNLTSGVVIVNTKSGYTPWEAKLQADPNSKLAYVGKGFTLHGGGAVNFSLDWAQSWSDTRLHYKGFDRITASAGYSNQFGPVSFNVRAAFFSNINKTRRDPQMLAEDAQWKNNNTGGRLAITGRYHNKNSFITSVDYKLSASLSRQNDWKSVWIYNPDGVIATTREAGLHEAMFKRYGYRSKYEIESIPLNLYAQVVANKYVRHGDRDFSNIKLGAEYTHDGNLGDGFTYDQNNPPQAMSSHRLRPRAYKDVPALRTLSVFLGDRSQLHFGTRHVVLEPGVRVSNLFLDKDKSGGNSGYLVAEPRVNVSFNVLNKKNNSVLDDLTLTGGFGLANKMPTLLYLYPEPAYYDNVALSRWVDNDEAERLALVTTNVVERTQNADLKPTRSRKWELGISVRKGQVQGTLTYFNEKHTNELGILTQPYWINYPYYTLPDGAQRPTFDAATQNVYYTSATGAREAADIEYFTERNSWGMPANTSRSRKHGVEYTLNLGEWKPLHTSLNVTGAWFYIKRQNMAKSYQNVAVNTRIQQTNWNMVVLPEGSGTVTERINSNFAFVTHLPAVRMVVTTTVQVVWRQTEQQVYEDANGHSRYYLKSYDDKDYMVVDPVGYYDINNNWHAWTAADSDNPTLNPYMGREQTYGLRKNVINPWAMLCMRLTKELGRTAEISFIANNLTNTRDYRKNKNSNALYQVYPSMYFGAEVKLKF